MCKVYGYCRISRKEQNIDRQIRNIKAEYPDAVIFQEAFTGRKIEGRAEYARLCKIVKPGDTIIFDSVSRMSRDAAEGWKEYERFFKLGVELVFLKEHHIDTATYKKALTNGVPMTGEDVDCILEGVNKYLLRLAQRQIELAFVQAQKEVDDLRQRTREGIETARLQGKQIGQKTGKQLKVKKAEPTQEKIRKYSRDFDGTLPDAEVIKLAEVARGTYYKYKKALAERLTMEQKAAEIEAFKDKIKH